MISPATSSRRRRVSLLIGDLKRAGAETQVVEHALALDPEHYAVSITLLAQRNDFAEQLAVRGIPVFPLGRRGRLDLDLIRRLRRHLEQLRPHVLHSHLLLPNLCAVLAGRVARVPAIVLTQHCSYEDVETRPARWLARLSHRFADKVVIVSQAALRQELAAGLPPGRAVHIPNAVADLREPEHVDRASLGLPEGPLVMTVGQLVPVKGHQHLIEAWPRVLAHVPAAQLVLLGDGPLREDLLRLAERLGLAASVRLLGARSPVAPALAACDVFVQPSISEGMPVAVLEAMSMGRPVVATAAGGNPELVVDGATGRLVPPKNPDALAHAIASLLTDANASKSMGEAGRSRVRERHARQRITQATVAVYEELLARRS